MTGLTRTVAAAVLAAAATAALPAAARAAGEEAAKCNCIFCQAKQKIAEETPWLKLFADVRFRYVSAPNLLYNDHHAPDPDWSYIRTRYRLGATVSPCKDIDFNVRFVYEPRWYYEPDTYPYPRFNEIIIDNLNVVWRKPCGLPLTAIVGRQDINLDGWLVIDGDPLDGSRTTFFDAARLTWDFTKECQTTIDTIFIQNHSDTDKTLPPINDQDMPLEEEDARGAIVWVSNKSLKNTEINPFYIYKHDNKVLAAGRDADIQTLGVRVIHDLTENWRLQGEWAGQFGYINGQDLLAMGFLGSAIYRFKDAHANEVHLTYEYQSGDNETTRSQNEKFDPLWGRFPTWSEGYGTYGTIQETGRINDLANFHRINVGWKCKPCDPVTLLADYDLLFADKNNITDQADHYEPGKKYGFSKDGCIRGHLLAFKLIYQFTPHISGHALAEIFFPGDYYTDAKNDVAGFFRYELVFAW